VVGVWVEQIDAYRDTPVYWRVTLRCHEGQVWQWKHDNEEDAHAQVEDLAFQVNGTYRVPAERPGAQGLPEDLR
jgi:hypothetical protein